MKRSNHKVSIKDIAREAGVSVSLVSFVLNGKSRQYRVSEEMTRKVLDIANELNYRPNLAAKSLRSGISKTIGVVLSDISNPFFANIARHIENIAEKTGYSVLFASSDESAKKMERQIGALLNKGIDGLIVVPCERSEKKLESLAAEGFPIVQMDRYIKCPDMNYVCLDNFSATYKATKHLIENGYAKIGIIAYGVALMHMTERIRGYAEAMSDNGLGAGIMTGTVSHNRMRETSGAAVADMLNRGADALVFASNTISIESLYFIKDMGIEVPDRLGLVGFDGSDVFDFFHSPLTYVRQPTELLAAQAVNVLRNQMENNTPIRQRIEIEGELIIRASSVR